MDAHSLCRNLLIPTQAEVLRNSDQYPHRATAKPVTARFAPKISHLPVFQRSVLTPAKLASGHCAYR